MVLLGAYKNGIELSKLELDNVANQLKVRRPEIFEYTSIDQILEICKYLEATSEGFVVRFESGLRVKIKGEQYVAIHRIISGIKPLNIWTALTTNTDLDVVFKQLPEEFIKDGKVIRDILLNNFNKTMAESNKVYEQYKHLPRKEIGLNNTIDPMYKAHLFCRLDGNFSKVEQLVWKMIRPDGNKLSGYVPSSSLNLFDQENK